MIGGSEKDDVESFYANHFIYSNPKITLEPISLKVDDNQLVEELILVVEHTATINWLAPNVQPTNKTTEFPLVALVKFAANDEGDWKVSHEHLYWDQASVLLQLGVLTWSGELDVTGAEQARKVRWSRDEQSLLRISTLTN